MPGYQIDALTQVNNGLAPDDGSGDSLRTGAEVINNNFNVTRIVVNSQAAVDEIMLQGNGLVVDTGSGGSLLGGSQTLNANSAALAQAVNNLAASQAAGTISYLTLAAMNADLTPADGVVAYVTNDSTVSNNGWYRKNGASGAGSWGATVNPVSNALTVALGNAAGFQQTGTGSVLQDFQSALRLVQLNVVQYGAAPAPFDSTSAFNAAYAAAVSLGGAIIDVPAGQWVYNGSMGINSDNISFRGAGVDTTTITRTSGSGYMFQWAATANTSGGGISNCTLVGINTAAANAGLAFGGATYYANKFRVNNVRCDSWAQYGCQIYNGNDFVVDNVRVTNHGLTTGTISSCIGFGVFPRLASSGGVVTNIYSEIGAACQANASANTAAVKLQTHQSFKASNITAIGGREECVSIDSIDGTVSNITITPQSGDRAGLAPGNQNSAHSFSGQTFVIDGVRINGTSLYGLTISGDAPIAGASLYKMTGCTIRNVSAPLCAARFLNYAAFKNCTFENWNFGEVRFSTASASVIAPTGITNDGNRISNVTANGTSGIGTFAMQVSNSFVASSGAIAAQGSAVSDTNIVGDSNIIKAPVSFGSAGNGLVVTGSANNIYDPSIVGCSNRSLFLPSGSNSNMVYGGDLSAGAGISDLGVGNIVEMANRRLGGAAAPTVGAWRRGDVIFSTAPSAGGFLGWVCVSAGTPGTWKTYGAISA